jgi:hypothetical protein
VAAMRWRFNNMEAAMPNTQTFWWYADEAMRCAREAKSPEEKRALTDLAFTWSQVAVNSEDREGKLEGPSTESH